MRAFFIKDLLVFWRDPKEWVLSLIIPFIIIFVVGFTLPGWIENSAEPFDARVGLVLLEQPQDGLAEFIGYIDTLDIDTGEARALAAQARALEPVSLLKELIAGEGSNRFGTLTELSEEEARRLLAKGELDAIVTVQDGFTSSLLRRTLLGSGQGARLTLTADKDSLQTTILEQLLTGFMKTYNLHAAAGNAIANSPAGLLPGESIVFPAPAGGIEETPGVRKMSAFQYFTLSTGILFTLFASSTMALKSATEQKQRVTDRIFLSGRNRVAYLGGKAAAMMLIAALMFTFILLGCHFILGLFTGYSFAFWLGLAGIAAVLSCCVGGLACLFASLSFRSKPEVVGPMSMVASLLLGTLGGSFVPIYTLPEWLQPVVRFTPNGRLLMAAVHWIQYEDTAALLSALAGSALFAAALLTLSVLLYPGRRKTA